MVEEKIEKEFDIELIENDDGIPAELRKYLKEGDMLVSAYTLNTDFLPKKWLEELAPDSFNQRVIWRHQDPEIGGRFYGRNIGNEVTIHDGKDTIRSYYRIFGGAEDSFNDKLQKYIKLKLEVNDPVGISKGFIINRCPQNGEITRVFALEDSITYRPKCKTCLTTEVFQMEDKEKLEKEMEIKQLQDELNSTKLQLEERDKAVAEIKEKADKLETLIEEKDAEKKTLEDQFIDVSNSLKKLEQKLIDQERAPYIAKLEELEKTKGSMLVFGIMKDRPIDEINARIDELKKLENGPQVVTKTLDEESKEALEADGDETKDVGLKAFRNNPDMAREIAQMKKEDAELGLEGVW